MNDIYNAYYSAKTQAWEIYGPSSEFITYRTSQEEAVAYVTEYAATRARLQGHPATQYKATVRSEDHLRFSDRVEARSLAEAAVNAAYAEIVAKEDAHWQKSFEEIMASYVPSGALDPSQPQAQPDLLQLMRDL